MRGGRAQLGVDTGPGALFAGAIAALITHYPVDGWWPASGRFEVMVGAVLVQNTRWANAGKALAALREQRLLRADRMAALDPGALERHIRPAGCQSVKAARLAALAAWVRAGGGVDSLAGLPTAALRDALLGVHGIGPETADAILCFAFERPVFIADRYARRWMSRMGLITGIDARSYRRSRAKAARWLESSGASARDAHAAIVLHAQSACRARPDCPHCPVSKQCDFYNHSINNYK